MQSHACCYRHVLAQFYDELARKEWSERAARGDSSFDINVVCRAIDRDILETARSEYDYAYGPRAKHDAYEAEAPSANSGRQGKRRNRGGGAWIISPGLRVPLIVTRFGRW